MARKLAAVAQLLGRRIEEQMAVEADIGSIITGFARTTAEVYPGPVPRLQHHRQTRQKPLLPLGQRPHRTRTPPTRLATTTDATLRPRRTTTVLGGR